jgi:endonuclease/exonuclease/phosphatase family metal-dependent hydrolase
LIIGYIAFVLLFGTLTDFRPDNLIEINTEQEAAVQTISDSILSVGIWNIGYAGLGEESDFFYDGGGMLWSKGHMVRPSRSISEKNMEGILQWAKSTKADFFLLQEVDRSSKRSYRTDQFQKIGEEFEGYYGGFATNYQSPWVPIPLFEPWNAYGKTKSGLGTYSRFQPTKATRYQLPGEYGWPIRIFQLDRCAAVFRFNVANGKELVLMNIHNSAFDKGGKLKQQQMRFLKDFFLAEHQKGNYVIAGGDWNQCPPFFKKDGFVPDEERAAELTNVAPDFLPADWQWIYDPTIPTNRSVRDPLELGETFVTIIDFFLVSPNVKVLKVKGMNLNFKFSDHQPVWMEIELIQEQG